MRLFDAIEKPDFDANLYGGLLCDDLYFLRYFPIKVSTEASFNEANLFLQENGYPTFEFDKFRLGGDPFSFESKLVSLYADPYCNETNIQLILIVNKRKKPKAKEQRNLFDPE